MMPRCSEVDDTLNQACCEAYITRSSSCTRRNELSVLWGCTTQCQRGRGYPCQRLWAAMAAVTAAHSLSLEPHDLAVLCQQVSSHQWPLESQQSTNEVSRGEVGKLLLDEMNQSLQSFALSE